ncbi:MAG: type III secretion system outer membrane ring subunit SctC [Alteromonadaceae bacterium]|nr:type III secretion system outer membrane ring subunit SctC [Alteromonadaceae bacterium]
MVTLNLKLALLALLIALSGSLHAGELSSKPFEFYGEDQALPDVLTAVATHSLLGVKINENIQSNFNGYLRKRNAREALDYLATTFDLIWYSDGATLYVDPINAMQSRLFQLHSISARKLETAMKSLGLWDARFDWRTLENSSILMVSGPPSYLNMIDTTLTMLNDELNKLAQEGLSVKVFKLTNASAIDRQIVVRDERIVLPGVASLLGRLMLAGSVVADGPGVTSEHKSAEPQQNVQDETAEAISPKATHALTVPADKGTPHPQASVIADATTNSVIVQDHGSRLKLYAELVAQLDTPREQLEVSLLIIDLTANSLSELGVDWTTAQASLGGSGLVELILPGASTQATAALAQTNADFLASVTALESEGQAHITSRPAIVTENGLEAALDNNETFFVRLQGERVAELEQITYGTLLRVTPRVMGHGKPQRIAMDVNIEDANRMIDGGVDSLPSIRNTQISTRALVPNGGSLLIGGYYRDASSYNEDRIPVLGDLPVLGKLFQHSGENRSQLIRIFMLSPRILNDHIYDEVESTTGEELSMSEKIHQVSDLSNFNPELQRLSKSLPCESALRARQRRNRFFNSGIDTRLTHCESGKSSVAFRVVTL